MRRFVPVLRRINERLVLPHPLKYRIMNEIATDLEDAYNVYVQQGLDEDEAEQKALTKIAADDTVIEQLIEVHETPIRKMLRRVSDKVQYKIELGLWISLLFVIGIIMARMLVSSQTFAGSAFNWLNGTLITGMFGVSIWKYYELYIKRDHSLQKLHRGLPLLIFISFLAAIAGTLGCFVELQHFTLIVAKSGKGGMHATIPYVFRSLTVVSFAYVAAITGAVAWLLFTMRILTIEDQEHAVLHTIAEY